MTKTELLAILDTKFYKVMTPVLNQTIDNLKNYSVAIFNLINGGLRDGTIRFYTEDEDTLGDNATAYWSPSEPSPDRGPNLDAQLRTYLSGKITDGTIEGYIIEEINAVDVFAVVKATIDQSGTLIDKRLLIDKDSGTLRYRVIP